MIESSISTPIVLASNSSVIAFQNDRNTRSATCCGWLQHNEGSPVYTITEPGLYDLELNATVSSTSAGIVALSIFEDGVSLPDTVSAEQIAAAGNVGNVSAHKIIRVCPKGNTQVEVGSVPSLIADTTGTATDTQIPTIVSATFSITRVSGC